MSEKGGKDWKTVKLPKQVRDDASDRPETYEQVMQAGLLALGEGVVAVSDGVVELSTDDNAAPEVSDDAFSPVRGVDGEELQEQLDRIESSATTAEERTGEIEKTLEALRQ